MSFIRTVADDQASDQVRAIYERDRQRLGYVANYTRAFSHRPAAFEAWVALNGAIKAGMELRRYELVTLAAARALRSSYCCLAHGSVLRNGFLSDDELARVAKDPQGGDLSAIDAAIMAFAEKVTREPSAVTQEDVDALRAHGLDDRAVLDIVLAAAARNFFSRVLDGTGALPDAAFGDLPEAVRDALTVGRPIEGREGAGGIRRGPRQAVEDLAAEQRER